MAETSLSQVKRRISERLLDEAGVSGVGLRKKQVVIYLERDDPRLRRRAERVARAVAPATPLTFEVSGPFKAR
jgi:hypothetical protein